MGFIKYSDSGFLQAPDDSDLYIVGVNYVASYACTNFWEDFREDRILADLEKIASMGLNAVRIPMIWQTMEPEQGKYSIKFVEKFRRFIAMCKKTGLYIMPWFLVGVATKGYDVPYRHGRSFFCDDMLEIERKHLMYFTGLFKDEEQILFWDICDEPEYYVLCGIIPAEDKEPFNSATMARWVRDLSAAIREVDKNHLVTLGYGSCISTGNLGIHIRDAEAVLDAMVVTAYPGITIEALNKFRTNSFLSYNVRFNSLKKPVLCCEAPGNTNTIYSEKVVGEYFRACIYGSLLNKSTGVLPWVFNDFEKELWHDAPLEQSMIEPWFGIVTNDGRIKQSGKELMAFAEFVKKSKLTDYRFVKSEAAILLPSSYYKLAYSTYPKIYAAFITAQTAFGNVDFVWDDEDLTRYKLLLIPSSNGMTNSAWANILNYAKNGGTVYASYDERYGISPYWRELFGIEMEAVERDFGLSKLIFEDKEMSLSGNYYSSRILVNPTTSNVLAKFEDKTPAFLENCLNGEGKAYLLCKSAEAGLLDIPNESFIDNDMFKLYTMLFEKAGLKTLYFCENSRIETGYLAHKDGKKNLVICINHDISEVKTFLNIPNGAKAYDIDTGKEYNGSFELVFEPVGIKKFIVEI